MQWPESKAMSKLCWEFCPCFYDWKDLKHFCKHVTTSLSSTCVYYTCLCCHSLIISLVLTTRQTVQMLKCAPGKRIWVGHLFMFQSWSCLAHLVFIFLWSFIFVIFRLNLFSWCSSYLFPIPLVLLVFISILVLGLVWSLFYYLDSAFGKMVWIRFPENAFHRRK